MTMRDCPDGAMRDQLPLYVSGRMDARARLAVDAHLACCADCTAEVAMASLGNSCWWIDTAAETAATASNMISITLLN